MPKKLIVHTELGPLRALELPLKRVMVLIGDQGSGKSTLAKLVYFFLHLPSRVVEKCGSLDDFFTLTKKDFELYFGQFPTHREAVVEFHYGSGKSFRIAYGNGGLEVEPSAGLKDWLEELMILLRNDSKGVEGHLKQLDLPEHFSYLPAGRNLIESFPTLWTLKFYGELKDSTHSWAPIFKSYLERIAKIQDQFKGRSLMQLAERLASLQLRTVPQQFDRAMELFEGILKGRYSNNGEERIHLPERIEKDLFAVGGKLVSRGRVDLEFKDYLPLSEASSGQRETLRLLQELFLTLLQGENRMLFVEEPEAHLFPQTLKLLIEFMTLVSNATGGALFITTHSPYVLSAFNNLLMAHQVGQKQSEKAAQIKAREFWLDPKEFAAFSLNNQRKQFFKSIFRPRLGYVDANELDSVSENIAEEFYQMLKLQQNALSK